MFIYNDTRGVGGFMKILLATKEPTLDSDFDERFARARYFLIYDESSQTLDVIDNAKELAHGAGLQAVQVAIDNSVDVILSAKPGENAIKAIKAANIKIYDISALKPKEAIEKLASGDLKELV